MPHDMNLADLHEKRQRDQEKAKPIPTVCLADVEPKPIRWLWEGKIARGKLTLVSGDPGLGKSLITVALAAAVSTGARWPVGELDAPLGSVLMLSDEDALDDTIRPRLDAAGADCSKVHAIKMVKSIGEDGEPNERCFSLEKDVQRLSRTVECLSDVALILIDPVSAYLGKTDSHNNADVRSLLSPLSELAEIYDVAVVLITHLNKGAGAAIYRSIGSIAFAAAARSSWVVTKDRDDSTRRLVLPAKNNLGDDQSGLAYRVEAAENEAPFLLWEPDPVDVDVNEALSNESDEYRTERQEAAEWLDTELWGNPTPADKILRRAEAAGHSRSTVKRAKKQLGVKSIKCGFGGGWLWYHPADLPLKSEEDHEGSEEAHPL